MLQTLDKINNLDLVYNDSPSQFVIKTMEEVDLKLGGIADKPHRHNYYSVIWSSTATGKHVIDFREYEILPSYIFFVSPWQVHQVITYTKPTGFVILFTREFLLKNSIREDFITNLKLFRQSGETPPLLLKAEMSAKLKIFADAMFEAFDSGNDLRYESIGAYLKLFLIECNGHCSLMPDTTNTQSIEVGKSLVKRFKEIVEQKYTEWHSVKEFADALNVTANYLNEVISSNINMSVKDYLQNRLILEAKRLVVFTDKRSKEIGYDLGFYDPSHFSKFFKSNTGLSLQEFKRSVAL